LFVPTAEQYIEPPNDVDIDIEMSVSKFKNRKAA
jgi:hypothetical protein